jgi:Cu(I)/Ag(I) efflux system membrane protein CusA/SilA
LGKILVTASGGTQIPVAQLLEQQVAIRLDSEAAAKAGATPATVAQSVSKALLKAGIGEDDFQVGETQPFPIVVRRARDFDAKGGALDGVTVAGTGGRPVPLTGLLEKPGNAEVDVVEAAQRYLRDQERVFERAWRERTAELGREPNAEEVMGLPGLDLRGCTYAFAGSYENQLHSQRTLMVVLPLALFVIFLILYFQFRSVISTSLVFSGILVAWAGGFILLWLYGQSWFLDFSVFGTDMRGLFQIHPVNLSVAVWVGFLALFGIATDDGVIMATYLGQSFEKARPGTVEEVRQAALTAGLRRVRPCLMTTATTVLALIPVLTSTGRGSDVMVPMAIPSFGGMTIEVITMLIVPVLYCFWQERKLRGSLVPRAESDASD